MGELCGLAAAFTWAAASILFSRSGVGSGLITVFKNAVSALLLAAACAAAAVWCREPPFAFDGPAFAWLAASAVIGLVIGDWSFYAGLARIGPRRAVALEVLVPVFGISLGATLFRERLALAEYAGIGLALAGVHWILAERTHGAGDLAPDRARRFQGAALCVLAMLCQAVGAALSKHAMERLAAAGAAGLGPALEAAALRLAFATVAGVPALALFVRARRWRAELAAPGAVPYLLAGSVVGTFLGVLLSMLSFHLAPLGVATTVTSFSPVFVIPLAARYCGERVTGRAVVAALVAVAGVALLALN